MNADEVLENDDPDTAQREGRTADPTQSFQVRLALADLNFRTLRIDDPVPTSRQILDAAEMRPAEDHALFQVLPKGGLELLRLSETVDLRVPGRERFVAFRASTLYRFIVDGESYEWGARSIGAAALQKIAGLDPEREAIWWERVDEPDELLDEGAVVPLDGAGVERFRVGPAFWVCVEGARLRWPRETITMEEIAGLGGWDPAQGVIEVDEDQNERTLAPGEVITLKPGIAFGKRLCWRRGLR